MSQYTQKAWESYCKQHNLAFNVIDKLDHGVHHPKWMKSKLLEHNPDATNLLYVDSDTMPKWDAPNIFEQYTEGGLYAVEDSCNLLWLYESVKAYSKALLDMEDPGRAFYGKYFNSGIMLFVGEQGRKILHKINQFYVDYSDALRSFNAEGKGMDQTPINLLVYTDVAGPNAQMMPYKWNMHSIVDTEVYKHNFQQQDNTRYFLKYGYFWHFNGMSIDQRHASITALWQQHKDKYV